MLHRRTPETTGQPMAWVRQKPVLAPIGVILEQYWGLWKLYSIGLIFFGFLGLAPKQVLVE